MKTPWTPFEQGGGAVPPTLAERIFVGANGQPDYGTAKNPIERKAFQNLPMPTRDAQTIYDPKLFKGPKKGTGLRHGQRALEGAGENYVDSFVTHPAAGNYEKLFAVLDADAKKEPEHTPQLTLEMIARQGYTNMGLNADEERMNSLRDRLRFMGASDEEIETQLKEARQARIKEVVGREMIPEQRELHAMDAWARQMGIHPDQGAFNFGARPPHDGNVFNFGTPRPSSYAGHQTREGPDNGAFVPSGLQGSGVHSIEILPSLAERVARGQRHPHPIAEPVGRTEERQLALVQKGPELIGRSAREKFSRNLFLRSARRVYETTVLPILSQKLSEAESKYELARRTGAKYGVRKNAETQYKKAIEKVQTARDILAAIEQGAIKRFPRSLIRGKGAPRKGESEYL